MVLILSDEIYLGAAGQPNNDNSQGDNEGN